MMKYSLILILSSPYNGIERYIVIWLAIAALASALLFIAIRFILAVIEDRNWNQTEHTAEEHLDRWAFLAGYSKEDLKPEPEQVAERPHVEMKGKYNDQKQVVEWGKWEDKSVLKS